MSTVSGMPRAAAARLNAAALREQIAERFKTSVEERALRQYVSILAGRAEIVSVDLQGVRTPPMQ